MAWKRFNGAATFRSRKAPQRSGEARRRAGFNGAATFRSRKGGAWGRNFARRELLQWGRDLSVAEGAGWPSASTTASSFNGAATFRSRKAICRSISEHHFPCFNGAATFRSRKVRASRRPGRRPRSLQWGRDLSVAEGIGTTRRPG